MKRNVIFYALAMTILPMYAASGSEALFAGAMQGLLIAGIIAIIAWVKKSRSKNNDDNK